MIITTKSGSKYLITEDYWERIHETSASGAIRTQGGSIKMSDPPKIGEPMMLFTDPINDGTIRCIVTTPVVSIDGQEEKTN